jgi:hypothetical protein
MMPIHHCAMQKYDWPMPPTLPLDHGCRAIHSITS